MPSYLLSEQIHFETFPHCSNEIIKLCFSIYSWPFCLSSQLSEASGGGEESRSSGPGMGVAVSVMANPDVELSAEEKTVFDWCKEGDLDRVRAIVTSGAASVNGLDEEVECIDTDTNCKRASQSPHFTCFWKTALAPIILWLNSQRQMSNCSVICDYFKQNLYPCGGNSSQNPSNELFANLS